MPAAQSRFLNVDLEIYSGRNVQPIIDCLGSEVFVLYAGRTTPRKFKAVLEKAIFKIADLSKSPDQIIRAFCRLIEAMPEPGRKAWDAAYKRSFSIGVEAALGSGVKDFQVSQEAVAEAARIGAEIVFTLYEPYSAGRLPPTIAPMLSVRNGSKAIDFYKAAFGATEAFRIDATDGSVVARLSVEGAQFWVSDESPEHNNFSPETLNGGTVRMIMVVEDPDTAFDRAITAGATVIRPVTDNYGWRLGRLADPFGHHWEIGKPLSGGLLISGPDSAGA